MALRFILIFIVISACAFSPGFKNITHNDLGKDYKIANNIMENSFLIGCNHGLTESHISKIKQVFELFLKKI